MLSTTASPTAEPRSHYPVAGAVRTRLEPRLFVGSETGVLRRVILHRPDLELKRLTPRNKDALLFDDVLWVRRARQEHDAFADALADRGVEVLYLERCSRTCSTAARARADVIERTLAAVDLGPSLGPGVVEWLAALPAAELADRLIGGITYSELPFAQRRRSARRCRRSTASCSAAAQPPVHARHVGVDLRRRVAST